MRIVIVIAASLLNVFMIVSTSPAIVPSSMTVQGRLTDAVGDPLPSGAKTFTFKVFDAQVSGNEVWPGSAGEDQTITSSNDGLWVALVGAILPLTESVFSDSVRWLEVTVDDGVNPSETLPRVRLATGPYAQRVATVDGASGGTITNKVSIGPGHTNTGDNAFVAGFGNTASGFNSTVSGGRDNAAGGSWSTVGGGRNVFAGGLFATVAGGGAEDLDDSISAAGDWSSVGGGIRNRANENYTTIAGGWNNGTYARYASISGGRNNTAADTGATIGGGSNNTANGRYSVVAGRGWHNCH